MMLLIMITSLVSGQSPCDTACVLERAGIKVFMTGNEIELLKETLCTAVNRYLEFGAGGSTLLAAHCGVKEIVSLDNAKGWLQKVASHRVWKTSISHVQQLFVDTGKLGSWSRPVTNGSYAEFIHYSHAVLQYTTGSFDVILVDGRFRIACALIAMQRMHKNSILLLHDYGREAYHVLETVLQKVKRVDQLVQFALPTVIDVVAINKLVRTYAYEIE